MDDYLSKILAEIKSIMNELGLTVSVAESITSGKLQDIFANISGSSSFFEGGITTYNIDQKVHFLGVDRDSAEACNCVSELTAQQMAEGVANAFVSDYGISTTGYAEMYGDEGFSSVHISIYNLREGFVENIYSGGISGDRESVRTCAAESALMGFHLVLLKKKKN